MVKSRIISAFYTILLSAGAITSFFGQVSWAGPADEYVFLIQVDSIEQFRFEGNHLAPYWVDENLLPLLCGKEVYFSSVRAGWTKVKDIEINAFLDEFCVSHKAMLLRPSVYLVNIVKKPDGWWLKKSSPVIYEENNKLYVDSPSWLSRVSQDLVSEVSCTDEAYMLEGVKCYTVRE